MFDINKRKELRSCRVKDILEILKELPEDADVHFCGSGFGYIHVAEDESYISFDTEDLDYEYEIREEFEKKMELKGE